MSTVQSVGATTDPSFAWCDAAACPHPSRLDALRSRDGASKARFEAASAERRANVLPGPSERTEWEELVGHAGPICGLHLRFAADRIDLSDIERRRLFNWMGHRDVSSEPYVVILSTSPGSRSRISFGREMTLRDAIRKRAPHAAVHFVRTASRESSVVVTTKGDLLGARGALVAASPREPIHSAAVRPSPIETLALVDAFDARDPHPLQEPSP